jgi:hypothetical protein
MRRVLALLLLAALAAPTYAQFEALGAARREKKTAPPPPAPAPSPSPEETPKPAARKPSPPPPPPPPVEVPEEPEDKLLPDSTINADGAPKR